MSQSPGLEQFMAAIRQVESGGKKDPYRAQGFSTHPTYGRAQGAYQIMSNLVGNYAAAAGYEGLSVQQFLDNPQVQDNIARYHFDRLYRKYGDWDLVAAAWFGGEGTANTIAEEGWNSWVTRRSDGGNNVIQYVDKMRAALGMTERGYNPRAAAAMPSGRYMQQGMSEEQLQEVGYVPPPWERDFAATKGGRRLAQDFMEAMSQNLMLASRDGEDGDEEQALRAADHVSRSLQNLYGREERPAQPPPTGRRGTGGSGTPSVRDAGAGVSWPQGGIAGEGAV